MTDAPTINRPRRFKASELPLTSATRTAIDGLAHAFKKKGGYDATRKQVWDTFEASVRPGAILQSSFKIALSLI